MIDSPTFGRRAALASALALLVVYVATLAPTVTFWDAGEFVAAARVLGIPHPPGTPLFVFALHAVASLVPVRDTAIVTNFCSAIVTAAACGLLALLVARGMRSAMAGVAAALVAGGMASVWDNATETEVYAAALLLVMVTLWSADRAGRTGALRWLLLTSYLTMLAVPLHLSALVAGPAVLYLAATAEHEQVAWGRAVRWGDALLLSGAWLAATATGRMSAPLLAIAAALVLAGAAWRALRGRRTARPILATAGVWLAMAAVLAIAASGLLMLLLRARHDPALDQGYPVNWKMLADVVARRQYAVAPLWPRQLALWLQLGNLFEYADWQVALSLGPTVMPTVARTLTTIVFAALGVWGSVVHCRADRRQWMAFLLLLLAGSVGVTIYLNMKASPSFGYGFVPPHAIREARERDYFFVLGFWAWGAWAGIGAVALVRRWRWPAWTGLAIAVLPITLNWAALTRRREPEASLPLRTAQAILESAPRHAVLFLDGDNDSYPIWYLQQVRRERLDVTPVTVPLLPAGWYRDEMWRRWKLEPAGQGSAWEGLAPTVASIANAARVQGRPIAVSPMMGDSSRRMIDSAWTLHGLVYVPRTPTGDSIPGLRATVDVPATMALAKRIASWQLPAPSPAVDPMGEYASGILACPRAALAARTDARAAASLDSLCNLR